VQLYLRYLLILVVVTLSASITSAEDIQRDIDVAKQEYEHSTPAGNEKARQTYVGKLAQIADKLVSRYRESGERNDKVMTAINAELQKHPLPSNSDAQKLSHLLVGKWESPRRVYVFRADGKYGTEDGPITSSWKIKGNQLIEGNSRGTIILLNSDYFIYSEGDAVFFHSRVKE
jgi:hypothetical protein